MWVNTGVEILLMYVCKLWKFICFQMVTFLLNLNEWMNVFKYESWFACYNVSFVSYVTHKWDIFGYTWFVTGI